VVLILVVAAPDVAPLGLAGDDGRTCTVGVFFCAPLVGVVACLVGALSELFEPADRTWVACCADCGLGALLAAAFATDVVRVLLDVPVLFAVAGLAIGGFCPAACTV
jgi:hypothetical protein